MIVQLSSFIHRIQSSKALGLAELFSPTKFQRHSFSCPAVCIWGLNAIKTSHYVKIGGDGGGVPWNKEVLQRAHALMKYSYNGNTVGLFQADFWNGFLGERISGTPINLIIYNQLINNNIARYDSMEYPEMFKNMSVV